MKMCAFCQQLRSVLMLQCIRKVFKALDIFHILLGYSLILNIFANVFTQKKLKYHPLGSDYSREFS